MGKISIYIFIPKKFFDNAISLSTFFLKKKKIKYEIDNDSTNEKWGVLEKYNIFDNDRLYQLQDKKKWIRKITSKL